MQFKDLNIIEPILKAIEEKGYNSPTPIQEQAILPILKGKDILGCAQTGTGKTAAFAIPILQRLYSSKSERTNKIKVLILTPTRELAIQIRDNFREYGKYTNLKCSVIFGGVNQHSQIEVLKKGVDILVATPGRLLDLIAQKHAKLDSVEYLVLDEADSMLDMGFIHDVKRILTNIPQKKQTLLFSATMPTEIDKLAATLLTDPVRVIVNPVASTADKINQVMYEVDKSNKNRLLLEIFSKNEMSSTLIFTRTKQGANRLTTFLTNNNIKCAAIHGNKSQSARQYALSRFKSGEINVLVATDIAARGIDIKDLEHVVNYEMPNVAETYVHRIGRTARAGMSGKAISLCDFDELDYVKDIEKLTNKKLQVINDHSFPMTVFVKTPKAKPRTNMNKRNSTKNNNSSNENTSSINKTINKNNETKNNKNSKNETSTKKNFTKFSNDKQKRSNEKSYNFKNKKNFSSKNKKNNYKKPNNR